MSLVRFGRWNVRADSHKTRAAYAHITGGAEKCGCNMCKNYVAARDQIFAPPARALLAQLGVDYAREIEVEHTHRITRCKHAYCGWFHLFGTIESGRDASAPRGPDAFALELEAIDDALSLGFTHRLRGVTGHFVNAPIVQLEFAAIAPWLLDIDEPS